MLKIVANEVLYNEGVIVLPLLVTLGIFSCCVSVKCKQVPCFPQVNYLLIFNPLMPGGNKKVTASAAGLFKYV